MHAPLPLVNHPAFALARPTSAPRLKTMVRLDGRPVWYRVLSPRPLPNHSTYIRVAVETAAGEYRVEAEYDRPGDYFAGAVYPPDGKAFSPGLFHTLQEALDGGLRAVLNHAEREVTS